MSHILDTRSALIRVAPILVLSVVVGVSASFVPEETLLISLFCMLILFILVCNRFYDFLLWACWLVFLLSQFHGVVETARWPIFLVLVLLSVYLGAKQKVSRNPVALGLGLVAIYTTATSLVSYYPIISLLKSISLLLLAGFLLFLPSAIKRLYPSIGLKEYILRMFLYLAIAVVLSNTIYYFIRPFSAGSFHSSGALLAGRFRGWFMTPNGIGAIYGIFFLPVLWFEVRKHKIGVTKLGLLFVFLLAAIQLLASQSRAGILAGAASIYILILGPRRWLSRGMVLGILGLSALTIFLLSPGNNLISRFIYRNEIELQGSGRLPVWIATWERFLARPLLGSGLGVADTDSAIDSIVFATGGFTIEKGNSYLAALEELGLVGVAILIGALLAPIIRACWRGFNSANLLPSKDEPNLVLIAIVIAGLVNTTFEAWLLSVGGIIGFSYWIIASLLLQNENKLLV